MELYVQEPQKVRYLPAKYGRINISRETLAHIIEEKHQIINNFVAAVK